MRNSTYFFQSTSQRKTSQQRVICAETSIIHSKKPSAKNIYKTNGPSDSSSSKPDDGFSSSTTTSNQLSLSLLPSSPRRPVKLPLRKHHTFHFQSSQTVVGAKCNKEHLQMALSSSANYRKQYRNEGPLLFKPFDNNHGFKPITPVPMSPTKPIPNDEPMDELSSMPKNPKHFEDPDSVLRQSRTNLRRHTSNVENASSRAASYDIGAFAAVSAITTTDGKPAKIQYAQLEPVVQQQKHKPFKTQMYAKPNNLNVETISPNRNNFGTINGEIFTTKSRHTQILKAQNHAEVKTQP